MPSLNKPIVEHLERSKSMCEDIAYKLHLTKLEAKSKVENITYLFEWNGIRRREKGRFGVLRRETNSVDLNIDCFNSTRNTITCDFTMDIMHIGKAFLQLNNENTSASLSIYYLTEKWKIHREFKMLVKTDEYLRSG